MTKALEMVKILIVAEELKIVVFGLFLPGPCMHTVLGLKIKLHHLYVCKASFLSSRSPLQEHSTTCV